MEARLIRQSLMTKKAQSILRILKKNRPAILLGNGIHRYQNYGQTAWESILSDLHTHFTKKKTKIPDGLSLTEFYDLIRFSSPDRKDLDLQTAFKGQIDQWEPRAHHRHIVNVLQENNIPVLTTNFDHILAKCIQLEHPRLLRPRTRKPTYYYPWEYYFSKNTLQTGETLERFAIWHLHGMIRMPHSMRLGLNHYMKLVHQTGKFESCWKRKTKDAEDRSETGHKYDWRDTWLYIFFNKPLVMFGLGLTQNEIYLRWLLIERAKYRMKQGLKAQDLYFTVAEEKPEIQQEGRRFLLESLGFESSVVETYQHLYEDMWNS